MTAPKNEMAPVGPDAAWQALVAAAHAWAEHLDQWDKFKFQTDHGLVYVSIGRAAECPDSFDELPGGTLVAVPYLEG